MKPHKSKKLSQASKAASILGKLGGRKGGLARARNLTHKQIVEIGRAGALKRWRKYNNK